MAEVNEPRQKGTDVKDAAGQTTESGGSPARGDRSGTPHAGGGGLPAAFYGRRGGRWADWWTVLHPPYTLWHVSYAVIGAGLVPHVNWVALGATAGAFFLAVGIGAHALDELHGRPLGTAISGRALTAAAAIGLMGAVGLGFVGVSLYGPALLPLMVAGVALVLGYNLELFGGRLHNDFGFAAAWGGFPVVAGFVAQAPPMTGTDVAALIGATAAAIAISYAQRCLSTPARTIRRQARYMSGVVTLNDGTHCPLDRATLLAPLEGALRAMSWGVPLVAAAVVVARLPGG